MKKTNFELTKLLHRAEQILPVLEQTNAYFAKLIRALATCDTCEVTPGDPRCETCTDRRHWSPNAATQNAAIGLRDA